MGVGSNMYIKHHRQSRITGLFPFKTLGNPDRGLFHFPDGRLASDRYPDIDTSLLDGTMNFSQLSEAKRDFLIRVRQ